MTRSERAALEVLARTMCEHRTGEKQPKPSYLILNPVRRKPLILSEIR